MNTEQLKEIVNEINNNNDKNGEKVNVGWTPIVVCHKSRYNDAKKITDWCNKLVLILEANDIPKDIIWIVKLYETNNTPYTDLLIMATKQEEERIRENGS